MMCEACERGDHEGGYPVCGRTHATDPTPPKE